SSFEAMVASITLPSASETASFTVTDEPTVNCAQCAYGGLFTISPGFGVATLELSGACASTLPEQTRARSTANPRRIEHPRRAMLRARLPVSLDTSDNR